VARAFDEHPDAAAVSHAYYRCYEADQKRELVARPETTLFDLATPAAARAACIGWDYFLPSSLSVRRAVLERVTPIPETLVICADAPIAAASMAMQTVVLPEALSCYRIHASNLYRVAAEDPVKARRKNEIDEKVYAVLHPMLLSWGVAPACVDALLDPLWIRSSRFRLRNFGGSHLKAFQTEMRFFNYEVANPGAGYLFFKYLVMGTATFLLPPRRFYQARDWYYSRNLGRLRDRIVGTQRTGRNPRQSAVEETGEIARRAGTLARRQ
jgi:hypothetical protein